MDKKCKNCGAALPRGASTRRKYCDARCRVQFNRASSPRSLYSEAVRSIDALGACKSGQRAESIAVLKELKKHIGYQLLSLRDGDAVLKHEFLTSRS